MTDWEKELEGYSDQVRKAGSQLEAIHKLKDDLEKIVVGLQEVAVTGLYKSEPLPDSEHPVVNAALDEYRDLLTRLTNALDGKSWISQFIPGDK